MPASIRILASAEVRAELIDTGLASKPIARRGGPLFEAYTIAVEAINAASAVVSVAVAAAAFRRFVAALLKRKKSAGEKQVTIKIIKDGRVQTLEVDTTAPDAGDKLFEFLYRSLD